MAEQRIQKVLSDQGVCSRRAAEKLIDEGRVKVNGHPVTLGDKMDPDFDKVSIDGKSVRIVRKRQYTYLMLNKPRGYITTASDERGRKTVMDLVSDVPAMLRPVGRLDKDSEGLLLMTNDGAFAQAVTHPSGGISKLYRVTVQPRADEATILKLSSGVVLDDGTKTMPCAINVVTDEPGVYETDLVGIRIENEIECYHKADNQYGTFLAFRPLTFVPIATSPIVPGVLDKEQVAWLNDYHRKVFEQLAPRLTEDERAWLAEKCAAIGC